MKPSSCDEQGMRALSTIEDHGDGTAVVLVAVRLPLEHASSMQRALADQVDSTAAQCGYISERSWQAGGAA